MIYQSKSILKNFITLETFKLRCVIIRLRVSLDSISVSMESFLIFYAQKEFIDDDSIDYVGWMI